MKNLWQCLSNSLYSTFPVNSKLICINASKSILLHIWLEHNQILFRTNFYSWSENFKLIKIKVPIGAPFQKLSRVILCKIFVAIGRLG